MLMWDEKDEVCWTLDLANASLILLMSGALSGGKPNENLSHSKVTPPRVLNVFKFYAKRSWSYI